MSKLRHIPTVIFILTLVLFIMGLMSSKGWLFELCAHFNLVWVGVFLIMVPFGFLLQNKPLLLGAIIASLGSIGNLVWHAQEPPQLNNTQGVPLKVLSANILNTNTDLTSLSKLLLAESYDIVLLQEVSDKWVQVLSQDKEITKKYPTQRYSAKGFFYETAILSRYPIEKGRFEYPSGWPESAFVGILNINGTKVGVLNLRPTSPRTPDKSIRRNEYLWDTQYLVEKLKGYPVIVAGDFNTSPWISPFKNFKLANNLREGGAIALAPTWPAHVPLVPIDHVLVSAEFTIKTRKVLSYIGSDHLPLEVNLYLHSSPKLNEVAQNTVKVPK